MGLAWCAHVQAHVAPIASVAEVDAMMVALQRNTKLARATHNMLAYRFSDATSGRVVQDYDDDGETAAGSRMLHLLQVLLSHACKASAISWADDSEGLAIAAAEPGRISFPHAVHIRAQATVQMADVQGACVVVSRWFGGVHLGPSRFAIINNTARQLLVAEGFMLAGATKGKGKR